MSLNANNRRLLPASRSGPHVRCPASGVSFHATRKLAPSDLKASHEG